MSDLKADARVAASSERRRVLSRRIQLFVAATITYNVIEAVVALAAGTAASSSALIGFGLDSIIEVSTAAAVAWQFAGRDPEAREKKALRFIAFSFFARAVNWARVLPWPTPNRRCFAPTCPVCCWWVSC